MTDNSLATTLEEFDLTPFDPATVQEYASQRVDTIRHHLNTAYDAMQRAQSETMFVIRDDQDTPPAHEALRQAEAALYAANDALTELDSSADEISQIVGGVVAVCQSLKDQRDQVLVELEELNTTFENKVNEQVQERLDEALIDNLATAQELEAESIRSVAEEIIDADFDFESVAAEKRAELERTLQASWQVAINSRPDLYLSSNDEDDDGEDD